MHSNRSSGKGKTMNYRLHTFLVLGLVTGLFIGAFVCMLMEQILLLQPQETIILLSCSGWCGIAFYFARLMYLVHQTVSMKD